MRRIAASRAGESRRRLALESLEDRRLLSAVPVGPEFQVNTHTTSSQDAVSVAMDAAGNFVVAWESRDQDGSGDGIFAQRYNAAGVAQGSEFQVNTYTTNAQRDPSVAMDSDGDFIVAWTSYGQDGGGGQVDAGVFARRYNAAGVPQGSEFQVNSHTTDRQRLAAVAMDADGDFVVTWDSYQDGSLFGIFAQRYDAAGVAQGGEFQVNTTTFAHQITPTVAMDSDGDFVVVWTSYNQDGGGGVFGGGVYAQRYNASGIPQGGEFQVNTFTTDNQLFPSAAMDSDGDFVVAWTSLGQQGPGWGVFAQRYNAAGVGQGGEFLVSASVLPGNIDIDPAPAVSMDAAGDFVVAWTGDGQDGSSYGVFTRRYNSAGVAQGSEFQVNSHTTAGQLLPAVAVAADGDFVVAWESDGQDGDDDGIYAQRYEVLPPATVTGRHLFYNESKYDGNSAGIVLPTGGANNDDSDAIATDKSAYLPGGGLIMPASMSTYSRGINGIMVDISGAHGTLGLADFEFSMSEQGALANNTPSSWVAAPAPSGFTVLTDTPAVGTDRVEFIWPNGSIENRYLEITVKGNDAAGGFNTNTGLAATDIFYFGNRVGDDFLATPPSTFNTTAGDEIDARNNPGFLQPLTNIYDYNKDSLVSAADQIIARNNAGFTFKIDIANPPAAPGSPADDGDGAVSAVAGALAIGESPRPTFVSSPAWPRPVGIAPNPSPMAGEARLPEEPESRERPAVSQKVEPFADEFDFDQELLDDLVAKIRPISTG